MKSVLAAAVLAASVTASGADIICGERQIVLDVFASEYGRWKITSVHRQQSTTVEILHAKSTETWAVMGKNWRGQHCITVRQTEREPVQLLLN